MRLRTEVVRFEPAYQRHVTLAVELLDAVTLARVTSGVRVTAEGWKRAPIVNSGGLFVWVEEDFEPLRKISVDPRTRPYEAVERPKAKVERPLTRIQLPPRVDYPFPAGMTGLRWMLVEEAVTPPEPPTPVAGAEIQLRWLDADGVTWREAPTKSHSGDRGNFAAIARLSPADEPLVGSDGALTVRVRVVRDGSRQRDSAQIKLPQGRIADPAGFLAWDELQP
jgi:hypothetical protein